MFDDVALAIGGCMIYILDYIPEAGRMNMGYSDGSMRDLGVLHKLHMYGVFVQSLHTSMGRRHPPDSGWYKVNVDGSSDYSLGDIFFGVIFQNSRGFFFTAFRGQRVGFFPSRWS